MSPAFWIITGAAVAAAVLAGSVAVFAVIGATKTRRRRKRLEQAIRQLDDSGACCGVPANRRQGVLIHEIGHAYNNK